MISSERMRRVKRRIGSMLLAVLIVLSLCTGVFAAEPESGLRLTAKQTGSQIAVDVWLTSEGATNGRIVVSYDHELVTLRSAVSADRSWITSINTETEGEVAFAWAASDLPAEETCMAHLVFLPANKILDELTFEAEVTELYDSGTALTPDPAEASVTIQEKEVPTSGPGSSSGSGSGSGESAGTDDGNPFTDIYGHWAYDEILSAYHAGLVNGITTTTFGPETAVTRGMFVTLLYRLEGNPAATGSNPFTDVPAGEYYTNAVIWAYGNGVVNGTSTTTFSPDAPVTRQDLVTMLYRYAQFAGMDTSASANLSSFTDSASVESYAQAAMQWAVGAGIVQGSNSLLTPLAYTTRAQAAAILVRFAGI